MIRKCIISCFFLISVTVYGQDSIQNCIRGKVVDYQTSEPIVSAFVNSLEQNNSCRTDWNGCFIICSNSISDINHLSFSYYGYETQEITFTNTKDSLLTVKLKRDSTFDPSNTPIIHLRANNSLISDGFSLYEGGLITEGNRITRGTQNNDCNASLRIKSIKTENDTLLIKGCILDNSSDRPVAAKLFHVRELGPKHDYSVVQEPSHEYLVIRELGASGNKGDFLIRVSHDMYDNCPLIAVSLAGCQTSVYLLDVGF